MARKDQRILEQTRLIEQLRLSLEQMSKDLLNCQNEAKKIKLM